MDLSSAQVIGAGLAAIGVGAAATGVGNVFAVAMIILYAPPAVAETEVVAVEAAAVDAPAAMEAPAAEPAE